MSRYFFRLDDIAPNMSWENFYRLEELFKRYEIKPLLAVIPDNQDPELLKYQNNPDFWLVINELCHDGWIVAQHGYQHIYKTQDGGLLNINQRGEFAGLDFVTQKSMAAEGKEVLKNKLIEPEIFVAPGHSFDKKTLKAIRQNGFRYISDGIALYPLRKGGLVWLPQIFWRPKQIWFGLVTIALHPNTMTEDELENFRKFIERNRNKIGNFSELVNWYNRAGLVKIFFTFWVNQIFKIIWRIIFKFKFQSSNVKSNLND